MVGDNPQPQSRSRNLAQLKAALTAGDPAAQAAVIRAGHYLGVAAASTLRLFNMSSVVLGGHFAILAEWMMPAFSKSLATFAPGTVPPDGISLSALGETGALVGAAGSVIRSLLDAPHRVAAI
jgi:predicted NBD/HSP70 family sugar kinase